MVGVGELGGAEGRGGAPLPVRGRGSQLGPELLPSLHQSPFMLRASDMTSFENIVLLLNKV